LSIGLVFVVLLSTLTDQRAQEREVGKLRGVLYEQFLESLHPIQVAEDLINRLCVPVDVGLALLLLAHRD
jgi:hypothetical protein